MDDVRIGELQAHQETGEHPHRHATRRYSRRTVALASALAAALSGGLPALAQDGTEVATPESGTPIAGTPAAEPIGLPTTPITLPDSPVGRQLEWFLGQIRAVAMGGVVDEVGLSGRLHPTALAAVPIEEWVTSIGQLAALIGPAAEPVGVYATPSEQFMNPLFAGADGLPYYMAVEVDVTPEALVLMFGLSPYSVLSDTYGDWSDLEADAAAIASGVSVFIGEVDGTTITQIHSLDDSRSLAIGSAFKLYVLGTLAQQVSAGELAWDDLVSISDADRSFPSGVMQLLPTGTAVTVRELADHMIAISDNTAADHLIDLVGRESIEAAQAQFGHGEPERNIPFITTRELFAFRVGVNPTLTEEYAAADVARRRAILVELDQVTLDESGIADWTTPRQIDLVEWYASVAELAKAMVSVAALADDPSTAQLRDILSISPGGPYDPAEFAWIGFKGGSEVGVLTLTLLVERADGRTFVVSVGTNDATAAIDVNAVALLTGKTIESLAELP